MWWTVALVVLKKIWAFIAKYAVYFLIAGALLSSVYFVYNKGYTRGYSKGYAQCTKDKPTYGSVGSVTNISEADFKYLGIYFKLLFLRFKIGR